MDTAELYAFVINNSHALREEFLSVTATMAKQITMKLSLKTSAFHIPEQDFFKYDSRVKEEIEYLNSIVKNERISDGSIKMEILYPAVFSIVYLDRIQHQWLLYADYIVMKKDGTVWVIETKGVEAKGTDKNNDYQIENKFNVFKANAARYNLCWGFARDKDNRLYNNNTKFVSDMADDNWKPLAKIF